MVKDMAVALPLNDVAKRQAILEKLNFDVTKALEIEAAVKNNTIPKEEPASKRRAATPATEDKATPVRRIIKKTE